VQLFMPAMLCTSLNAFLLYPKKEHLSVIWAFENLRAYIGGLHVTVFCDHSSVKSLMSQPNPTGSFEIIHKPGVSKSGTVCLETPYFLPVSRWTFSLIALFLGVWTCLCLYCLWSEIT